MKYNKTYSYRSRKYRLPVKPIYFLFFCFIFFQPVERIQAQEYTVDQIKAAHIITFAKYIKWENDENIDKFRIGILDKSNELYNELKKLTDVVKIKGRDVEVNYFINVKHITKTHILYIGQDFNNAVDGIIQNLRGTNTLIVTDNFDTKRSMINFVYSNPKRRFEVNDKNMVDEKLLVSGKLQDFSTSKTNWQEQYLRKDKLLEDEKEKVKVQQEEIDNQQEILQAQKEEIEIQKKAIDNQQKEMQAKKEMLRFQNNEIKKKKAQAEEQEKILQKQLSELQKQRLIIFLFIALLLVFLFLGYFIFRAFQIKKKANTVLQEKNEAILLQKEKIVEQNEEILQQKEEIEAQRDELEIINKQLEKLSIVARETDNAVIITDAKGNFEWINEGFTRMYGMTFEQLIERRGSSIVLSSSNPNLSYSLEQCRINKKSISYESFFSTVDSRELWTQTTLTPIMDENETIYKLIAIDTDITKIKMQEKELQKKNVQITDSISYAKRIQEAVLPHQSFMKQYFPEMFIFYQPRDIVSGDFYWFSEHGDHLFIAAVDCTGHGVPGAFMSMIGNTLLNEIVKSNKVVVPSDILDKLHEGVLFSLKQGRYSDSTQDDGMDISLCRIDKKKKEIQISSANHYVYLANDNEFQSIKGDIFSIGGGLFSKSSNQHFTNHSIEYKKDTALYLFSDGYVDQFGGKKKEKFMVNRFEEFLKKNNSLPMDEQFQILKNTFEEWKAENKQVDDILVMGIRL